MLVKTLLLTIALLGFFKEDNNNKAQKKQFIYVLRYSDEFKKHIKLGDKEQAAMRDHVAYLRELTNEGNCYLAGRTNNFLDSTLFGLIIFDAANLDAAKEVMNNDPMIKDEIMVGELHPFSVVFFKQ